MGGSLVRVMATIRILVGAMVTVPAILVIVDLPI